MQSSISASELSSLLNSAPPLNLIDVRTPAEFAEVHVRGAKNVPLSECDEATLVGFGFDKSKPLYVLCKSGGRAKMACGKLAGDGFSQVILVEGGTNACIEQGVNLIRGGLKVISIEQQIRVIAGAVILVSLFGWMLVSSAFLLLAAFVGAGLIFSGLTGICGLAMLLEKMPWNKCGKAACGNSCSTN